MTCDCISSSKPSKPAVPTTSNNQATIAASCSKSSDRQRNIFLPLKSVQREESHIPGRELSRPGTFLLDVFNKFHLYIDLNSTWKIFVDKEG